MPGEWFELSREWCLVSGVSYLVSSLVDSKKGAGKVRNSEVQLMWVVAGWYERIAIT